MSAKREPVKQRRKAHLRKKFGGLTISVQQRKEGGARVVIHDAGGGRKTQNFATVEAAKAHAQGLEIKATKASDEAVREIGPMEMRWALDGKKSLAAHGKTIKDAFDFYLAHLNETTKSATVSEVVEKLLHHLRRKSARYKGDLKCRLGKFEQEFGTKLISIENVWNTCGVFIRQYIRTSYTLSVNCVINTT